MADITSILTIMGPGGLSCGTLLDLRGERVEFEINADLARGYEADWRMELRGTTDTARGRLRVEEARSRRDGMARYVATIIDVRSSDRAVWDAWRSRGARATTPLRIDDPLALTPRMASQAETENVLRRLEQRRPAAPPTVLSTPLWARAPGNTPAAPAGGLQQAHPEPARPLAPTSPPARVEAPPPVFARSNAPAPSTQRPVSTHPGMAHHKKDSVESAAVPDVQLNRLSLPERGTDKPRPVLFRVERREDGPPLFSAIYQSPLRYRADFREQLQWGAILIEIPSAAQVGLDVELRIVAPDGRELCVPANVLTASVRSTCLAFTLTAADLARITA